MDLPVSPLYFVTYHSISYCEVVITGCYSASDLSPLTYDLSGVLVDVLYDLSLYELGTLRRNESVIICMGTVEG